MWLLGLLSGMVGMVLLAGGNDFGLIGLIPLLWMQIEDLVVGWVYG